MKKRRIEANLRQQDVAARLARPQSFVAKYENGERRLDVVEFIEVAEAIGFDPADFIRDFRSSGADTCDSVTSLEEAGESTHAAEADTVGTGVPSRTGLSHKPASGVPSPTIRNDGTEEPEVYRDRAGRRRRRRLASPEARRARNAKARELHALGMSIREIAHELGCGHGTVERALKAR